MMSYQIKVHNMHNPNGECQVDNSDHSNDENEEIKTPFPPSIYTNFINDVHRIMAGIINVIIR